MKRNPNDWLHAIARATVWLALALLGLAVTMVTAWIPPELAAMLGSRRQP